MEKTAHHASLTRKALIVILLNITILILQAALTGRWHWDKKHEK